VLLPATDGATLEASLVARLRAQGWKDFKGGLVNGSQVILIHHDAASVALDYCGRQTAPFEGGEPVPALEGRVARVTWSPSAVASFGVLAEATVLAGAISGESIDAATRARVAAEGLWEAGRNFALAGNASGAFFDRIDASLRLAPFELTVRAKPGPAFTPPPAGAWKASPSVAIDGTWADLDGASALSRAWPFPADTTEVLSLARYSGWSAWLVALPHLLESAPLAAAKEWSLPDAGPMAPHFERAGFAWSEGHQVSYGVLPATTTRAQAECVFSAPPCPAKSKLKLGTITTVASLHVKLLEVDHRFVVLYAGDDTFLGVTVKLRPVSPLHVDVSLANVTPLLKTTIAVPDRVAGDVSFDDGVVTFRLAPP
jgi:hypothetical protein